MKLSFKYPLVKLTKEKEEIINELFFHTTKVYNMTLYEIKEGIEKVSRKGNINIQSTKIYTRCRKENWHSEYLHSHTMQEVIINVVSNYKSYLALEEKYQKNPKSLKGKPRIPHYKNEKEVQEIVFTKYAIRVESNKIKLSLSKSMQEKYSVKSLNFVVPSKVQKLVNFKQIKMIKIKKNKGKIEMDMIYEKEEEKQPEENKNIMAIDLGLNNIVACTNKDNCESMLVSGKELKSKNRYINNEIIRSQKIQMMMLKDSNKYKTTKRIKQLYEKRKRYIETYMHKVSKKVIEYAEEQKCNTIVIGDLKDIKEGMNYNKNFVQIPLQNLVRKIEYKAKLKGIKIEKISEKYTSGVSAIDNEEIKKENYNKKRRIYRGLFITKENKRINADINGSLNILRKYIISKTNLEIAMNNGREQRPIKKRVA